MKPDPLAEGRRWLAQAERDLAAARDLERAGHFNVACFQAQQAAEKAVKAVLYAGGSEDVFGHSARDLLRAASVANAKLRELDDAAKRLDRFYIPTRYPNASPGGIPADAYDSSDAQQALAHAAAIVAEARASVNSVRIEESEQ